MDANEACAVRVRDASYKRDELFGRSQRPVADDLIFTEFGRQSRFGNPADCGQSRVTAKLLL
jgi:hypothetical protein